MRLQAGVTTVRGIAMAVAFPHPSYVRPGVGDVIIEQLRPFFPALPIMLASTKSRNAQAYAPFETDALFAELDLAAIETVEVDLEYPPMIDELVPF